MTAQWVVRDFTCALCGAPRTTPADALVVLCRHCGAILTSTGADGAGWVDIAKRHADGIRQIVKPSYASARLLSLSRAMADVTDRALWRLMCEEQVLLTPLVHPGIVSPLPADPMQRAEHVRRAVVLQEICAFDPTVRGLMNAFGEASGRLTRSPDPIAVAREMLERARAYYRALASHPDLPPGALREGAEHHARELVRGSIQGYAPLVGDGVIEKIRVDVLGDRVVSSAATPQCSRCGAPLERAADTRTLLRCRHCGAMTTVEGPDEDAWMASRLALWEITLAELVRRDELDGPAPAISAIGSFLFTGAADVSAEKAQRFLACAIPWSTVADVERAIDCLALGVADGTRERALLDGLRARVRRDWRHDPGRRPVRPVRAAFHPPPSEAEEAAWIESALATFRFGRAFGSTTSLELLGHPLAAIQIAAVHDQPAGVSPRAAMVFFERAAPRFDRAAMHAELTRLLPGYDHPRVVAFAAELARLLAS